MSHMHAHCCSSSHTYTATTHCHVFDIHVSLLLQLGYYLPVEPLKLQVRRRRNKREERGGRHTGDYILDGRMECYSLSALLSAANWENAVSLEEKKESDHLECTGACVRG